MKDDGTVTHWPVVFFGGPKDGDIDVWQSEPVPLFKVPSRPQMAALVSADAVPDLRGPTHHEYRLVRSGCYVKTAVDVAMHLGRDEMRQCVLERATDHGGECWQYGYLGER